MILKYEIVINITQNPFTGKSLCEMNRAEIITGDWICGNKRLEYFEKTDCKHTRKTVYCSHKTGT